MILATHIIRYSPLPIIHITIVLENLFSGDKGKTYLLFMRSGKPLSFSSSPSNILTPALVVLFPVIIKTVVMSEDIL
jgi:hypothetical protein